MGNFKNADIIQVSTKQVYQNPWMRVREDVILRSNGRQGIYGVVEKPDFAIIAPLTDKGFVMVQQYRYTVGGRFWEFPQGSKDGVVSPVELARCELREETGYTCGHIEQIADVFTAYGYSSQRWFAFFARQLVPGTPALDPEELDLVSAIIPVSQVQKMILNGEIKDATTIAVFGMLKMKEYV